MDRWQELGKTLRPLNSLVVNLYGGPGTGKSTTAALLFGELKKGGINAELAPEFAKELVWEQRHKTLESQVYIVGKQAHRIARLQGQVEVIITDGPILHALVYTESPELVALARAIHAESNNFDVLLKRDDEYHSYKPHGRYQDLTGAQKLDRQIRESLEGVPYTEIVVSDQTVPILTELVYERLESVRC